MEELNSRAHSPIWAGPPAAVEMRGAQGGRMVKSQKEKVTAQSPPHHSQSDNILDVVEHELIPRLLMLEVGTDASPSRSAPSVQPAGPGPCGHSNAQAHQLALLTLEATLPDCERYLQSLREQGVSLEAIFLDVLQPAARILGTRWKEDSCSFVDVTTGLWQLQQIFHRLLHDFQQEPLRGASTDVVDISPRPSAFFCTLPGAQHRLGVQMISAFFCRAGWQTGLSFGETATQIGAEAKRFAPDLLGVSLSCEQDMHDAPAFILALKQATTKQHNKTTPILMIGGPGPLLFPELALACQADVIAGDAPEALASAWDCLASRRPKACA
jgi:methanogenic corrinoid protein MtbC1